jgi:hypothetical protein
MEAKSSAGVPLSSPAAAQRCAEGAGLDSGTAAEAQSALPSIAFPAATAADRRLLSTNAAAPAAPQLQSRISTSLTDLTPERAAFSTTLRPTGQKLVNPALLLLPSIVDRRCLPQHW